MARFEFQIYVKCDTEDQAYRVLTAAFGHDEGLGFDYTIGMQSPEPSLWDMVVAVVLIKFDRIKRAFVRKEGR